MAWTARTPVSTTYSIRYPGTEAPGYMLMEDGGKILQEDGGGILLDNGFYLASSWTQRSSVTTSWTPRATVA